MSIINLLQRERNELREMLRRVDERIDAEAGAVYVNSTAWHEQLGADFYATGHGIDRCRSEAMRRGYRHAEAAFNGGLPLEEAIEWQLCRGEAALALGERALAEVRR